VEGIKLVLVTVLKSNFFLEVGGGGVAVLGTGMKYFAVQLIKFSYKFKVLENHSYFEFSIGMQRGWDSSILILSHISLFKEEKLSHLWAEFGITSKIIQ
jgi:hypothetical protein